MKKQLIAAGIVAATGIAGMSSVGVANAQANAPSNTQHPMNSLVEAIASKFNLTTDDVQQVFDEQRSQMQEERETAIKEKIAGLVGDGKLTREQADKINAKRAELQAEREANRSNGQSLSRSERKAKMEEHKTELDAWLKSNNIDVTYAYLLMGAHGHGR